MEKLLFIYYSLLFCLATITFTCSATTYTVGDSSGWDISTNLDTWIADKMFKVGDALGKYLILLSTQRKPERVYEDLVKFITITHKPF